MSGDVTVGRWIRDRARTTPTRVAIDCRNARVTYAELDAWSDRAAARLAAAGVVRGDRVASISGNDPAHVALLFACAKLGAALVPLSWRLAPVEIRYELDDADPRALVVADEHGRLADETESTVPRLGFEELEEDAGEPPRDRGRRRRSPLPHLHVGHDREAEGRHPHAREHVLDEPLLRPHVPDGRPRDRAAGASQYHIGGWNVQSLLAWWAGATVVLEPAFDAERALALIAEKRVTTMMGVPATYLFMAEHPSFANADLSSLRLAVVGGAPMPESLLETWKERGVEIVQGYGLTEAAPNVLCLPPEDASRKVGFAGKPYAHVDVALRDLVTGEHLDGPATGELVVRGPNVFAGYWRNPEATAATFAGGWLLTGDIAERDVEGYYRIAGRLKDLVISGGENVYPAEIEDVLHAHPAVAEAAVIGVPDERWGEVCTAYVALRPGAGCDEEELLDWCRPRLARFKVPRTVHFTDALPRSGVGKVLKGELRAAWEGARQ